MLARSGFEARRRTNVQRGATSFFGRVDDLVFLERSLAEGASLVTLVGVGGIGKTRVASRFAEREAVETDRWPGGVWFVDLSCARNEANEVLVALARALDVSVVGSGMELDRIGAILGVAGSALVVLDNCEHAIGGVRSALNELRALVPDVRFLATSRERLRLVGERVRELAPLEVDAPGESEAVQLFVDRARLARHDYVMEDRHREVVAEICRQLEGIPLAIELAAARASWMDTPTILERLTHRFELLRGGAATAPSRQQSMLEAIRWSWRLLSHHERMALAQCAVFRGGFTLASAERVLDLGVGAPPVLEVVQALHDKSLLYARRGPHDDGMRLGLYETVRQFAQEELVTSGDEGATHLRHARAFVALIAPLGAGVDRHGGADCLCHIAAELENVFVAHERAVTSSDGELRAIATSLVDAAAPYLALRGPTDRFRRMLDDTLAMDAPEAGAARRLYARTLVTRAILSWRSGRAEQARADLARAMPMSQETDDRRELGRASRLLGLLEWQAGHVEHGLELLEQAAGDLERAGEEVLAARARGDLARVLVETTGELERARPILHEAIETFRRLGSVHDEGLYRINLAISFHREGRLDEARKHYEAALEIVRAADARRWTATALENLGLLHQEEGRFDAATSCFEEAASLDRALGERHALGSLLGNVAGLAHERGDLANAERGYTDAIEVLTKAGRTTRSAYLRGALGAARAQNGDLDGAARALDEAEATLATDDVLLAAVSAFRARLDAARATMAPSAREAERHRANARMHLSACEGLETISDEVRFAMRIAEPIRAEVRERTNLPVVDVVDAEAFVVDRAGRWFAPPGRPPVDLARRETLRLMLAELVRRWEENETPVTVDDLRAAGWPGEAMSRASGAARVYTALSTLRNLGLRDFLSSLRGRHSLTRKAKVVVVDRPLEASKV